MNPDGSNEVRPPSLTLPRQGGGDSPAFLTLPRQGGGNIPEEKTNGH